MIPEPNTTPQPEPPALILARKRLDDALAQREKAAAALYRGDGTPVYTDTPARLAEYVANFDPSFIGITGTPAEIAAAATPLGIYYKAHEGTAATGYLIDHTATVLVLDRQGSIRLLVPFGATGAEIAGDLHALLRMN